MTIVDDDNAPTISIGDNTSSDESGAVTNLIATLSAASEKTITVDYATSDGTATAGDDYTAVSTTTSHLMLVMFRRIYLSLLSRIILMK